MMHRFIDNAENLEHFEDIYKSVFLSYTFPCMFPILRQKIKKKEFQLMKFMISYKICKKIYP